ncbi:hypothetical protein H6G76_11845 [Nostoc sp. FACHB-152]|uniref:hypothetical protein n=1 Tax=unclassified Nostoc TaxID=2593658 RepID=UPI0016852C8C|nr:MULTISPECIES: hypothetical protein [unclassified Nostoc]MBD2447857.1 hypothetical protein [Nostoc sp. FACHB-152]MBD2468569.1 hypothetical protein [Nostoc sp. FACHB-145]
MGIYSKFAFVTILTLAIAGCAAEENPQASSPVTPPVPPSPSPAAKASPVAQAQSFRNPTVPEKKATNVAFTSTSTLIQPTDGKSRMVLISKGRPDPFAQIVGSTSSEVSNNSSAKPVPRLPNLPTPNIRQPRVPMENAGAIRKQSSMTVLKTPTKTLAQIPKSILPKVLPQVIPSSNFGSVLPPAAQPDLAKAVVVTGVVLIGSEPQAIIQIPNEPSSRYVQAGQRLANGLLVKRIEMNEGSNPVVILEQYGIEVARMVGEGSANSTPSATSTGGSVSVNTPPHNPLAVGAS